MKFKIQTLICALFLASCTSLNTLSVTSIPAKRDKPVKAQTEKMIFLGFNFDNDFVDDMTNQLKRQCPNGMISGILTKDEAVNYFLYIVWKHQVTATGYCVASAGAASTSGSSKNRKPSGADEEAIEDMGQ
jgi:hypothetical protein